MNRLIALATVVLTLVVPALPAFAQSPATPPGPEQKPAPDRERPGGPMGGAGGMGRGQGGMHGGSTMGGGHHGMHGGGMMGGQGGMHDGMGMGRERMRGGSGSDMCRMMMGGGLGMLGEPGDPKAVARMLKLRGDMLKAIGEVLLKHGAELEKATP